MPRRPGGASRLQDAHGPARAEPRAPGPRARPGPGARPTSTAPRRSRSGAAGRPLNQLLAPSSSFYEHALDVDAGPERKDDGDDGGGDDDGGGGGAWAARVVGRPRARAGDRRPAHHHARRVRVAARRGARGRARRRRGRGARRAARGGRGRRRAGRGRRRRRRAGGLRAMARVRIGRERGRGAPSARRAGVGDEARPCRPSPPPSPSSSSFQVLESECSPGGGADFALPRAPPRARAAARRRGAASPGSPTASA